MNLQQKKEQTVNRNELETRIKKMYREVALHPEVEYHFEMGRSLTERLGYAPDDLNQIPSEAIDSFAGVGFYFDLANLQKGESVVDLGSGSGMDVFYAANKVGPNGEVTGIDMTDEQLAKSRKLAKEYGYDNIYFIESYIESLPLRSGSIDVVISNGVINLSASKESVFAEVARILRPGGRLAISDIVSEIPLPENISCNASLWAACIGGALQIDRYKKIIEDNGLSIVETKTNPYAFLSKGAKGATKDYGISSISILAIKQ